MSDWHKVQADWLATYPDKHPLVLQYLYQQGIALAAVSDWYQFDYEDDLHDPFLLPDMGIAVERILRAIKNDEQVLIFGDYDADGLPSVTILDTFFKQIKFSNYSIVIPDRNREGFGLKSSHIELALNDKVDLLITVDCGSAAVEALQLAARNNLDVIVTDHHEVPDLPTDAQPLALVNPMASGSVYPFPAICGTTVAFKLVQAIITTVKNNSEESWPVIRNLGVGWEKWLLDLVAVATVGDMMPLRDENRTLVHFGLQVLNQTRNYGLRALIDSARVERGAVTETDIAYRLAPRLNAASRVGQVMVALDLLTATDPLTANSRAADLEDLNQQRKKMLTQMVKVAHKKLGPANEFSKPILSVGDATWLPGMCGILASRLVEEYGMSAFVWGRGPATETKGSCRAKPGDNVYEIMTKVSEDVLTSFGGHVSAGGFVVKFAAVHKLQTALEDAHQSNSTKDQSADTTLDKDVIDTELAVIDEYLLTALEAIAPFGQGFPRPKLSFVCAPTMQSFGKQSEHLKLLLTETLSGVMWQTALADLSVQSAEKVQVVGDLSYDNYTRGPRLTITSITAVD